MPDKICLPEGEGAFACSNNDFCGYGRIWHLYDNERITKFVITVYFNMSNSSSGLSGTWISFVLVLCEALHNEFNDIRKQQC